MYEFEILCKDDKKITASINNNDYSIFNELDDQILKKFDDIINFNNDKRVILLPEEDLKRGYNCYNLCNIYPDLNLNIIRLTSVLVNCDEYSISDLQYCERCKEYNILPAFDYKSFFQQVSAILTKHEIITHPKHTAMHLSLIGEGPYSRGKNETNVNKEDFNDSDKELLQFDRMVTSIQESGFDDRGVFAILYEAVSRIKRSLEEAGIQLKQKIVVGTALINSNGYYCLQSLTTENDN